MNRKEYEDKIMSLLNDAYHKLSYEDMENLIFGIASAWSGSFTEAVNKIKYHKSIGHRD